jgi:xylulokinase
MAYQLGIDTGTSSCKAALIDSDGKIAGRSNVEYSLDYSHGGTWIEFDAEKWYDAAIKAIKSGMEESSATKEEIASVGIDRANGQPAGLDKNGVPVRPLSCGWTGGISRETEELNAAMGVNISRITCNRSTSSTR